MKAITIKWKDGGKTMFTVKDETQVVEAYAVALDKIESIIATDVKTFESEIVYEEERK